MKILMVCLGNICRSPLAEGILKHKVRKAGLDWTVESAGTGNWHIGEAPHHLSQKVAKANGIDICDQKGRQFVKEDMLKYDKIIVMDKDNYEAVKQMSRELWNPTKVDLLLNYSYPGEKRDVPDPWYGKEDGFHTVYEMIDKACEQIINHEVSTINETK
jgi:protein-tyrosine phosphatase